jgi:hypothetical protein
VKRVFLLVLLVALPLRASPRCDGLGEAVARIDTIEANVLLYESVLTDCMQIAAAGLLTDSLLAKLREAEPKIRAVFAADKMAVVRSSVARISCAEGKKAALELYSKARRMVLEIPMKPDFSRAALALDLESGQTVLGLYREYVALRDAIEVNFGILRKP